MELVRDQIAENENFSTRRHGTDLSRSTVCRIIKKDLGLFAYKAKIRQELLFLFTTLY